MATRRQKRVAELIHHELSNLLTFQTQDPRIGFVTITEVEITPDLKAAKVYVSVFSDDEQESLAGLESAISFFRRELARKMQLRYTPTLKFEVDRSVAYGSKIETILSKIDIPPEEDDAIPDDAN